MEKELLEELYHRYGQEIYRYLYAICRNRLMAEDIMQDVFCKALISLPSSHVNARAWLYMVGRNLLLNEMKKQKRQIYSEEPEKRAAAASRLPVSTTAQKSRTDFDLSSMAKDRKRIEIKGVLQNVAEKEIKSAIFALYEI